MYYRCYAPYFIKPLSFCSGIWMCGLPMRVRFIFCLKSWYLWWWTRKSNPMPPMVFTLIIAPNLTFLKENIESCSKEYKYLRVCTTDSTNSKLAMVAKKCRIINLATCLNGLGSSRKYSRCSMHHRNTWFKSPLTEVMNLTFHTRIQFFVGTITLRRLLWNLAQEIFKPTPTIDARSKFVQCWSWSCKLKMVLYIILHVDFHISASIKRHGLFHGFQAHINVDKRYPYFRQNWNRSCQRGFLSFVSVSWEESHQITATIIIEI